RGKRSVALDLKHPDGKEMFGRLVARSDVVFSNARGTSPERLGITYEQLKAHNPAIVCAFLTGFGRHGPRADQPAYEYIVQAMSGMAAMGGEPDGPPVRAGVSVVDFSAGLAAAVAMLAGLHRAKQTGLGCDIDTSLFATALNLTNYLASWTLTRGYHARRQPRGAHPSIVPSQLFEAADGWVMVMCQTDAFFRELAERMEIHDVLGDPRFATMAGRLEHKDELLGRLEREFKGRSVSHWLARLEGGVPVAPVNDLGQALADPQVEALDLVVGYDHPQFGYVKQVAGPVQTPGGSRAPAPGPALGADTQGVLSDLAGVSAAELAELKERGVVA
ncbi:MAG TPA: CoA transferase, partial [Trueperaceae bacterium]